MKTPEGIYKIDSRNPQSSFHLALHISYPSDEDNQRASAISVSAGSDIMIHGIQNGRGWIGAFHRWKDWTAGCIALTDEEIEELWRVTPDGTTIEIRDTLFTIDRNRITCAGGVATLDMMLHLIANKHGRSLAEVVANGLVRGRIRHDSERQRVSADDAFGPSLDRVSRAVCLASIVSAPSISIKRPMPCRSASRSIRPRTSSP